MGAAALSRRPPTFLLENCAHRGSAEASAARNGTNGDHIFDALKGMQRTHDQCCRGGAVALMGGRGCGRTWRLTYSLSGRRGAMRRLRGRRGRSSAHRFLFRGGVSVEFIWVEFIWWERV